MLVYDKTHELARALKHSDEYRALLAAQQAIAADEQTLKMVKEFLAKQMEVEYEALAGKGEDKARAEQLQKLYELLMLNSKAKDFIQAYFRFQRMMADVYKIIGEAVAEGLDFFVKR
ncbi:YlbF family regulator [Sporolituus thermophilus]|uniref:Cell fate regulator YlbF, YheA/YmcA/DUF963 family (Controls sporulation, competence, biofilm development) n=1 Tax=Sporolituus thermophilus DSM 23256 TaxID=1123285 RepID=A0A1G7MAJ7_9FIRM|nr:YlbF family regulator [Sporolituus thermophilus]SDF58676.1 Cell fate regulator YlbF, YheA/YmcA/DUF963 family (controls sporulation, competence, biofilm development) [Sporolituus thermophilus DSM 23256]